MADSQYCVRQITLDKQFLMWLYTHPLISTMPGIKVDDEFYIKMWENQPQSETNFFGGLYGEQFTTFDQLDSFNDALANVLAKHKINMAYADELLYLVRFYGADLDRQAMDNSNANRLLEYTRLILDLAKHSERHFSKYEKDKAYKKVYDPYTVEYFFARESLLSDYTIEEIIECRPNKNIGDIISYMRFKIGRTELNIPYDFSFSLNSDSKLRSFDGEPVSEFLIPKYLRSELLRYTLDYMVDEHRRHNTPFYQTISKKQLLSSDFKSMYRQYRKNRFSRLTSLTRLGVIVTDYLSMRKSLKTKRSIASFLFDYFSLLKVFTLKKKIMLPSKYSELSNFYNRMGITSETVRLMMKGGATVGGI